jgi:Zn-dependent protease
MLGFGSLPLGRLFGIRIGVNASWFLVLFLFIYLLSESFSDTLGGDDTTAFAAAVAAALLFFGSIVLHELGHALAARRSGIDVAGIDLFFFGGIMKMSRDTDSPGTEFKVAVAGPLVTLGIVVAGALLGMAIAGGPDRLWEIAVLEDGTTPGIALLLLSFLVTMNVGLLAFNLVPAFPLDGGRIARAAAWRVTGDRAKATRFSARIGQGFGLLLIAVGVWFALTRSMLDGLWLIVLGWLLSQAARAAVVQSAFTERLAGVTVADIMDAEPVTIPADLPAARAYEEFFLRFQGWDWFAVVEPDGRYVGVAHRAAVTHAAEGLEGATAARELVGAAGAESQVREDAPLEALLGSESLRRLGALMAVDPDGRLRGVVTVEQVSRALQAKLAPS